MLAYLRVCIYIYIHAWNTTTTEYGVISGLFERKRGVKTRVEFRLQPHVFLNKEPQNGVWTIMFLVDLAILGSMLKLGCNYLFFDKANHR